MGPKALQFIHAIARKLLSKRGKGIASIGDRMQAEAKAGEIAETFRLSGLTPNKWDEFIKSENDVVKYLNIIESSKKPQILRDGKTKSIIPKDEYKEYQTDFNKEMSNNRNIIDFPPDRVTDWTKARPQPPEIKTIDGVQTTRGMGDLFERQMKNIGKETDDQIIARLNKGNKEGIASMKSKLDDAEDLSEGTYSFGFKKGKEFQLNANSMGKGTLKEIIDSGELSGADLEAAINALKNRKADGGRAGLYQGGQAEIEPDLSNIGHGSDALMARNMLIAPGSQATTSTGLNYLLGEDNDTTRVPYKDAGPVVLPKPKPMDEYLLKQVMSQAGINTLTAETRQMLIEELKEKIRNKNSKAEGGPARQNFAMGKRAFLKMLGGVGAGIAGIKTGLLGLTKGGGKKVATEAVKEAATSGGGVPPYFLNLVRKIKNLGDDVTEKSATLDRQKVTKYKDYELTEDVSTGRQEITRMKVDDGNSADYYGQPLTEETYMSYTPGEEIFQETAKGKTKIIKTKPEYEEGTAYLRSDRGNAGDVVDESFEISDEVIKEGTVFEDTLSEFGKADGGRIGYAGGSKVVQGLAALIKKKFGKKAITTADKLKTPQKTLDREMFSKFKDRNLDPKRQITDDEFQDLMEDVGDLDAYNFDGTIGSANKIRKEAKDYQDYMYKQYKMGKLDPVAGDKSPGRKRFLEKKLEDMEGSGDRKLMSRDEVEELSTFDLGTEMDNTKLSVNKEIKEGVDDVMRDTSPAGLEKSIEVDNLMLKYEGISRGLAKQIANDPDPVRKANVISMVEQTIEMGNRGKSGDEIIEIFKRGTDRTKQATGGLAAMLGE